MELANIKILEGASETKQKLQFALIFYYKIKQTIQRLKNVYLELTDDEGLEVIDVISSGKYKLSNELKSKYPKLQEFVFGFDKERDKEKISLSGYNTIKAIIDTLKNVISGISNEDAEIIAGCLIMGITYPQELIEKYVDLMKKDYGKILEFELNNDYIFRINYKKISDYVKGIVEKSIK